jgi:hypothetical protein
MDKPDTLEAAKILMGMNRKDRRAFQKRTGVKIPGSTEPLKK